MVAAEFSPVERRILNVLSDGMPHGKAELIGCLYDGDYDALRVHIVNIRKKLLPKGQTILCDRVGNDKPLWRHVLLMKPPSAE